MLWLIPSDPARQLYRNAIDHFSALYGTPEFTPHLTFGSLPEISSEKLESILKKYSSQINSLELEADFLRCSSNPFRNLVHQLTVSDRYRELAEGLVSEIPDFRPKRELHISLKYGYDHCAELDRVFGESNLQLPDKIRFSAIEMISLGSTVEDWKVLFRKTI
ncbi:hypothetical protein [Rhodohalobacter sp. SW132]|uniref:hypothetical protein n=1 Tax=Rhodohalobacter sp. SW132 TaxID=2293433 RepID=UPI0013141A98|nr:hypothetical protein [Rhodohalobacter sp. SW132]